MNRSKRFLDFPFDWFHLFFMFHLLFIKSELPSGKCKCESKFEFEILRGIPIWISPLLCGLRRCRQRVLRENHFDANSLQCEKLTFAVHLPTFEKADFEDWICRWQGTQVWLHQGLEFGSGALTLLKSDIRPPHILKLQGSLPLLKQMFSTFQHHESKRDADGNGDNDNNCKLAIGHTAGPVSKFSAFATTALNLWYTWYTAEHKLRHKSVKGINGHLQNFIIIPWWVRNRHWGWGYHLPETKLISITIKGPYKELCEFDLKRKRR